MAWQSLPKAVTDERPFGDFLHQRDHHRLPAKTLAHTLTQRCDIHIVIYDLAIVYGNVLAQVLRFHLDMVLLVNRLSSEIFRRSSSQR